MKRNFLFLLSGISIALFFVVSTIIKYNSMLSEKSLYAISGTQENYSWAIAKFSIQLSEFYSLIKVSEVYSSIGTADENMEEIREKLDILYSRVQIIRNESESTTPLYKQKGYKETIDSIYDKLNTVDLYINTPSPNIKKVVSLVDEIKPYSTLLNNLADHAEVKQRTMALEDFKEKRKQLFTLLTITAILVSSLCVITSFYLFKLNKLLDSEKKAFNNKNAFLGVVGHELRTSLQAIISSIDVVIRNNDYNKQHFHRLENAATKMERQMKDLAEFAKIDNGYVEINKSSFNLKRLINTSISDSVVLLPKPSVTVEANKIPDIFIISDSARLMQIMENLITNAIKYTEIGTVFITASIEENNTLIIKVKDNGQGIPKDKITSIFSPFVRINNSKEIPGFGMGLAIVNGVIKAMRGSISVKSDIGKGSVFTVRLPIEISSFSSENQVNVNEQGHLFNSMYKEIKILLVDDNEMSCTSIASLLGSAGYKAEYTTSPERALEKLLRKSYDLVLSDLQMPIMTGDELYKKIRIMDGPNKNTPFIFISAYSTESPISSVSMLTKPVRIKDINNQIYSTMENK
ncbi:hypothetical protein Z042_14360 [Chania multitudinisentens RB-25]|uniref:histidine kinase n=1 Tax=Chania multitudinisentens RB-25 TaxID=1441930 RepID=W0LFE3_9GAMM|nr:hybrid sensor histidine kinase/response regulator [Chania multitudinisentens]AHG20665.1 hypothetical protein Z042_14360 [Chania multitudinisentens RB-25]